MGETKRLKNLRTLEVSLVGTPANRRKFLLTKSMDDDEGSDDMDDELIVALKEALALLSPYREKGCSELMMGMEKMVAGEEWPFAMKMSPSPVDVHVPSTELEKGEAGPQETNVEKEDEPRMDDKKLDLTTLPPEVQAQIDSLFKSQEEAVRKAAELEAVLKEERDKRLTEEALAIAKGFSNLPINAEEFGPVVKALREKAPQEWAEVCKALTAADKAIGEGKLFDEVGTTTSPKASSVMGQINALADGLVQKSEIKLTREQAIDQVLKSNPDLYNEYLKELGQ
jgi:hypothetical protein